MATEVAFRNLDTNLPNVVSEDSPLPVEGLVVTIAGVVGTVAHDASAADADPLLVGGYASAAAPTNVSADGDAVNAWYLRNGAQVINLSSGGTLILSGSGTATGALRVELPTNGTGVVLAKDNGPAWTSVWGVNNEPVTSADMTTEADVSAAPTAGQKLVITDGIIFADGATQIDLIEETSGTVMFTAIFGANGGYAQITPRGKRKLAVADKKIQGISTEVVNVSILVGYYSEA